MSTVETLDRLLEDRLGRKQMAEIKRKKATDIAAERIAVVKQIAEIEAEREAGLTDLTEKYKEASGRYELAHAEFVAAAMSKNALYRKRANTSGTFERKIEKLRHELRKNADPRIDEFIRELWKLEHEVHHECKVKEKEVGFFNKFGYAKTELSSNHEDVRNRVEKIRTARKSAEDLKQNTAVDIVAAIKKIRDTIPTGNFSFTKVDRQEPGVMSAE